MSFKHSLVKYKDILCGHVDRQKTTDIQFQVFLCRVFSAFVSICIVVEFITCWYIRKMLYKYVDVYYRADITEENGTI